MLDLGDSVKDGAFQPKVLREQVSQVLMEAILSGRIAPGEQLVETKLQNLLNVSRSPLRESFRDLEKKGLVVIVPRKGAFVKPITKVDIQENFPVRAVLEGLAAREAHPKIGTEGLSQMAAALEGMQTAGHDNDLEAYRKHHFAFHDIFIKASGNQLLIDLLHNLRMHHLWYFVAFGYHQEIDSTVEMHKEVYLLFLDRNADLRQLEFVVRNQIEEALPRVFGDLEGSKIH